MLPIQPSRGGLQMGGAAQSQERQTVLYNISYPKDTKLFVSQSVYVMPEPGKPFQIAERHARHLLKLARPGALSVRPVSESLMQSQQKGTVVPGMAATVAPMVPPGFKLVPIDDDETDGLTVEGDREADPQGDLENENSDAEAEQEKAAPKARSRAK